jgi:asparagine synthase (glutamine-hydrolysing)
MPQPAPFRVPRALAGGAYPRDEAVATCRRLFLASVAAQQVADVPVGCALSGGTDSSAILAAMRAAAPQATLHAVGYCADHPVLGEERWIAIAAGAASASLRRVVIAPGDLARDLDDLIAAQDEPFGSTSVYAQYAVFRAAREAGITVMLDGQGADELLGGYLPLLGARLATLLREGGIGRAWAFARACRAGRDLGLGSLARQTVARLFGAAPLPGAAPPWLRRGWFAARGVRSPERPGRGLRAELESALRVTSLPALLRYEDRNSMRFGIESRVPFCQLELAEFLLSLPDELLIDDAGTTKSVLRAALRGLVPDPILDRRDKIGFATPEAAWMTALGPWMERVVAAVDPAQAGWFDLPRLRAQVRLAAAGRARQDFALWRTLNLLRWQQLARERRAA